MIVGLGNPGRKYEGTRHNAGFEAADILCERLGGGRMTKLMCRSAYALCRYEDKTLLLVKPQTFMNLSGEAVRDMAERFSVPPEKIIVLSDDVALPSGRLRIRMRGSDGGHNGLKNIIYHLQSDSFPRVRIGVGAPEDEDMADFVLSPMDSAAMDGVRKAPEAALALVSHGASYAMQHFNGTN
ncbi:MAG: aminoacyl-tRNA hydrolase [Clostridia bacterium]|nr:aminoacyl-tRNA hydrolase [Clostridia bacterium]